MKKLISLVFVICITIGAVGCENDARSSVKNNTDKKSQVNVGVIFFDQNSSNKRGLVESLNKAAQNNDINSIVYDCNGKTDSVQSNVENIINNNNEKVNVKIIAIENVDSIITKKAIDLCQKNNIEVIVFGKDIEDERVLGKVIIDEEHTANLAKDYISKAMANKMQANVIYFKDIDNESNVYAENLFKEKLKTIPNINIENVVKLNEKLAITDQINESIALSNKLDLILCDNPAFIDDINKALVSAEKSEGVTIISKASDNPTSYIENNVDVLLYLDNKIYGETIINCIVNTDTTKENKNIINLDRMLITKDNVSSLPNF